MNVEIKSCRKLANASHSVYINGIETYGLKAGIIDGYGVTVATWGDNEVIAQIWDKELLQIDRINMVEDMVAVLIKHGKLLISTDNEGRTWAKMA